MDIIFLHGWGHSADALKGVGQAFEREHTCHYLNLQGFGGTAAPTSAWSAADYAHHQIKSYMKDKAITQAVLIGHSFGAKVAFQTTLQNPESIKAVVVIAGTGVKRKRSVGFKIRAFALKTLGKGANLIDGLLKTSFKQAYGARFGSADYRAAQGVMKQILVQHVNEDYTALLPSIKTPTLLIYGQNDTATPPEMGQRMAALLPNARYIELPHQDHYALLSSGRFQVQAHIKEFFKTVL